MLAENPTPPDEPGSHYVVLGPEWVTVPPGPAGPRGRNIVLGLTLLILLGLLCMLT